MDGHGAVPHPTRPDLLSAALGAHLPAVHRPAKWFSEGRNQSFKDRLVSNQNLTEESARRLEMEYRRYLYLKAAHGGVLTPSKRVDQAWHLHMETPEFDWNRFCIARFGTKIEHFTGLSPKDARLGYQRTLDLYRQEFGHKPPKDIWPSEADQARARIARRIGGLGFASSFLGIGIGIGNSVWLADPGVRLLDTTGGILAACLCYGGFGLFMLGTSVVKGTDLEEAASCG